MKKALIVFTLVGLASASAAAQGRGNTKAKDIPPGHMPRAGECRVWYDGVPPGRQPAPTSCAEAERIASRNRNARVIYGDNRGWDGRDPWGRADGSWGRADSRPRDGRPAQGRAVPRGDTYPGTSRDPDSRYPQGGGYGYGSFAYRSGYEDGADKAREDTRDGDRYDPARHGWYKSANRGYNSRYGSREQYAQEYRDGFLDGYRAEYRGRDTRTGGRWWPF